jgi:hypothetical protein
MTVWFQIASGQGIRHAGDTFIEDFEVLLMPEYDAIQDKSSHDPEGFLQITNYIFDVRISTYRILWIRIQMSDHGVQMDIII